MNPKKFVESIQNKHLKADREMVLDSLAGAIDRLQKAFPRYGSFLMEFIQNADDAESKSLEIRIIEDNKKPKIVITNDGKPFSEEDVKSICKVGRSSKTPKDYIGYLGVGFKAVFLISDSPEIHSGVFHFKFDKNAWNDSEHIPWQIIPIWIDDIKIKWKANTVFILPLKNVNLVESIRKEIEPEQLNNRILLFLKNLKKIDIVDVTKNLRRTLEKFKVLKTKNYEIYQIREYENGELRYNNRWLVFRSVYYVPDEVKNDYMTKEWERDTVNKREVVVAYKLDNENNLIEEEKGTAHMGVFSFLPLKEIPSGLNFLLQADFLTTPGRSELARKCLWNSWLADKIYDLIVNKCIPMFLSHDKWKMNFTEILYSSEGGHELFENHIKKPLDNYLESNPVLIADDNSVCKVDDLVLVPDELKSLLNKHDIKLIYPTKKVMHRDCKPHGNLKIDRIPKDLYSFVISDKGNEILKHKAKKKDVKWFKKLYSLFVERYSISYFYRYYHYNLEYEKFWNKMRDLSTPIILTEDYELVKISECYVNPRKIKIPPHLKDKFKIVHPQIARDEKFKEFRKKLNEQRYTTYSSGEDVIKELTEGDIKTALTQREIFELNEKKWKKLPDEDKIEKIKEIKKLWREYSISIEKYKSIITLKSKSGQWTKPEKLVFPLEYNPGHNIEILIKKGLLDEHIEFISPEFIANCSENDVRDWRSFFEELGVDTMLKNEREGGKKEKIVQRIGVLTALKYEKECGRKARELGESERRGYDIISKSDGSERYIEVKSSSSATYDIFITVNEFKALREKKEKYFLYIILDALRNPKLCITHGDELLVLEDVKVIIPYNKWKDLVADEFQPNLASL